MQIPVSKLVELLQFCVDAAVRIEQKDPAQIVTIGRLTSWDLIDLAKAGADADVRNALEVMDGGLK